MTSSQFLTEIRSIVPEESLVLRGSPDYDQRRLIYNRMHDARPVAIVGSLDTSVISAVVKSAQKWAVPLAVRGGGHHIAGFSTVDEGVVIDFSRFRRIRYDARTRLVSVEPGARLGDIDATLARHSRCLPSGTVSDTGITGLTLGGGIGWLVAGYGLTCDYLVSARVLLADGSLVVVDSANHPQLFSALRGGGVGGFGIIVELVFETVAMPDIVAGSVRFYIAESGRMLEKLQDFISSTNPREISFAATLGFHQFSKVFSIDLCCFSEHDRWINEARGRIGGDWSDVKDTEYVAWQRRFDHNFLPPKRGYWESVHFDTMLSDTAVFESIISGSPSEESSILLEFFNPDTLVAHSSGSMFPLRSSRVGALISARWLDRSEDDKNVDWVRSSSEILSRMGTHRAYSNYSPDNDDTVSGSYSDAALDRINHLAERYDPSSAFTRSHRARLSKRKESAR